MCEVRRARSQDSGVLTDLAIGSEGHWGYDSEFMESFKSIYRVTEDFIQNNPTYIMEDCGDALGFYSLVIREDEASLEYFYIDSSCIGKGYGRLLWKHVTDTCRMLGVKEFTIVTSPQAKEFYIKMGACYTGEVESLVVKGRSIPRLNYILEG